MKQTIEIRTIPTSELNKILAQLIKAQNTIGEQIKQIQQRPRLNTH